MAIFEIPFKVVAMTDRNATVASVIDPDGKVLATGSAKRLPGDPFNERTGLNLACARALQNYGYDIEADAL